MGVPRIAAAAIVFSALWVGSAEVSYAEGDDPDVIWGELERLRTAIVILEKAILRDGATSTGLIQEVDAPTRAEVVSRNAKFDLRLAAIDEELGRMTGFMEELEHTIGGIERRLDELVAAVDFRLAPLEEVADAQRLPLVSTATSIVEEPRILEETVGAEPLKVAAVLPEGTPAERYDFASGLLRSGRYGEAEQAFKTFVMEHPNDRLAGNAQYWLGETHYVRHAYEQAATAFLDGYQNYPDSPKAPDNLLKLGMTLHSLGQRAEACVTLKELVSKFPNAIQPIQERANREMRVLNCP